MSELCQKFVDHNISSNQNAHAILDNSKARLSMEERNCIKELCTECELEVCILDTRKKYVIRGNNE